MYDCVKGPCQDGAVIDHLGINCADWEKSKAFYDEVLGVLGYTRQLDYHVAIGYGHDGKPKHDRRNPKDFNLPDRRGRYFERWGLLSVRL